MDELKVGTKHEEREHYDITHGNIKVAAKIAKAHLMEDPKYYTHLDTMEVAVKKKKLIDEAIENLKY